MSYEHSMDRAMYKIIALLLLPVVIFVYRKIVDKQQEEDDRRILGDLADKDPEA